MSLIVIVSIFVMLTVILMVLHFFSVWVLLVVVVTLMLLDKHVVMLVLLERFTTFFWCVLVGRLRAHWLYFSGSVDLTFMKLDMLLGLHLQNQMAIFNVRL